LLFLLLFGRRGDPAAASAGERPPPIAVAVVEFITMLVSPSLSTFNNAGAIVLTDAKVLRCCIMS